MSDPKDCTALGCHDSPIAKGLCRRHYEQERRREKGLTLRVVVSKETLTQLEAGGRDPAEHASDILAWTIIWAGRR